MTGWVAAPLHMFFSFWNRFPSIVPYPPSATVARFSDLNIDSGDMTG